MPREFLCLVRGPYHGPRDHFIGEVRSESPVSPRYLPSGAPAKGTKGGRLSE